MRRGEGTVGTALMIVMSLGFVACEFSDPGTPGELGDGEYSFEYRCHRQDQMPCVDAHEGEEVPEGIVVGGRFGLWFHGESSPYTSVVKPASPTMVESVDWGFVARLPGKVAMLGIAGADGRVLDMIHVNLVQLHALRVEGPVDGATLAVGEQWQLDARPLSESGVVLAGTLDCEWHSSDESIVMPVQASGVCSNDIRGMAPGTATITMTSGDVSQSLDVMVE